MIKASRGWESSGSFEEDCEYERVLAREWASSLSSTALVHHVKLLALDNNALTLYERKALLLEVLKYLKP